MLLILFGIGSLLGLSFATHFAKVDTFVFDTNVIANSLQKVLDKLYSMFYSFKDFASLFSDIFQKVVEFLGGFLDMLIEGIEKITYAIDKIIKWFT